MVTRSQTIPAERLAKHQVHPLEPVVDAHCRVLILGSFPSPQSRAQGFYYRHPQNRFWPCLAALFDAPVPETDDERRRLCLDHGIALWDVLASCDLVGASDASIINPQPNDLARIFDLAPIEAVFTTGGKATELYRELCEPRYGRPSIKLPSTSPANARMRLNDLIKAYQVILDHLPPAQAEGRPETSLEQNAMTTAKRRDER